MKTQEFKISIHAPKQKVWAALWEDKNYREWTSVFSMDSWADTDWKKGSKVLFLDGKGSGMVSRIAENIPNEFMSIEHLGEVRNGKEILDTPEIKLWAGAHENYRLTTADGKTEVTVELEIKGMAQDMLDYFLTTWPTALQKLKEVAERG